MTEIELNRHSAEIDPSLHIWGYEIPVYLFLGGVVAGIMILTPLIANRVQNEERSFSTRIGPFAAVALLSLGMLMLFLDLAYKLHVFRFYTAWRVTSPMSWGSWILLAIYPATLMLGLRELTDAEVQRLAAFKPVEALKLGGLVRWLRAAAVKYAKAISAANVALGIGLGAYTGLLLSTLGVRNVWSSSVLAPLFLVSGISTGAAFLMALPISRKEHHLIGRVDIAAIVFELSLIGVLFIGMITGSAEKRAAAGLFLGGEFTALFWSLVVIAGLAVPLALEVREIRRHLKPSLIAPLLLLVGGLSLRWILVLAGQA